MKCPLCGRPAHDYRCDAYPPLAPVSPVPGYTARTPGGPMTTPPPDAPRPGGRGMSDHCPACRIVRELDEHRATTAAEWSQRRAAFNFARVLALRACPDYQPTNPEGARMTTKIPPRRVHHVPRGVPEHVGGGEASGPKRIQRKRTKGWRMPRGAIYVGRPSKWGNPYAMATYRTAEECVRQFRQFMQIRREPWREGDWYDEALWYPTDAQIRADLAGRDLACWCPLDQPCHADILLELANTPALTGADQ